MYTAYIELESANSYINKSMMLSHIYSLWLNSVASSALEFSYISSCTCTEYRIQKVFIVNQIKPLYYNMLLFTINIRRQI